MHLKHVYNITPFSFSIFRFYPRNFTGWTDVPKERLSLLTKLRLSFTGRRPFQMGGKEEFAAFPLLSLDYNSWPKHLRRFNSHQPRFM